MNDVLAGRREANKARTRAALIAAVYDVIETDGVDALTAERLADVAGISRRTFFNYFASVEALVASDADEVLDRFRVALAGRPESEPPIVSVLEVLQEVFTLDLLAQATRAWRTVERVPAARRYTLEARSDVVADLAQDWGRCRLDPHGTDPLRTDVLTAVVITAFDEARQHWLAEQGAEIDEAARQSFLSYVRRALDMVRPVLDMDGPILDMGGNPASDTSEAGPER